MPMLPAMIRRQEEAPPRGSTGSFSLLPPRANSPTGSHCSFQASTPPASAPHSPSGYLQKFSTKVFRWLIMLTFLYMYCICIAYVYCIYLYWKILNLPAGLSGVGAGAVEVLLSRGWGSQWHRWCRHPQWHRGCLPHKRRKRNILKPGDKSCS